MYVCGGLLSIIGFALRTCNRRIKHHLHERKGRETDLHSVEVEAAFVPPPLQDHVVGGGDGLVGPRLVHHAFLLS